MSEFLSTPSSRRHDLDALRAGAMLLGIVYHAALAYAEGFPWMVQDSDQSLSYYAFQSWVHGFRMQLFFLLSGFFTAMLWRRRGLGALVRHRTKRVLLPCLLGVITIIPLNIFVMGKAMSQRAGSDAVFDEGEKEADRFWLALREGNSEAVISFLGDAAIRDSLHPEYGTTALATATLFGREEVVRDLLDAGVDVNARNRDGATALHAAAFLGHSKIFRQLVEAGADVEAKNAAGEGIPNTLQSPNTIVTFVLGLMGIERDIYVIEEGRSDILEQLGIDESESPDRQEEADSGSQRSRELLGMLMMIPVFHHLWFLWFLFWLVLGFALLASFFSRLPLSLPAVGLTRSPFCLLWLVPLTLVPQWSMGEQMALFGPDTSLGLLPIPHVFCYYAIFFGFGILYYDADDQKGELGRSWKMILPMCVLVLFPIGLEITTGKLGIRDQWIEPALQLPLAHLTQVVFAWLMSFGCIGMFRSLLGKEQRGVRYLSDSAYWLYVAHLPLVIALQGWVASWSVPALAKLGIVTFLTLVILLLSYQLFVRYTFIGRLLNGPRTRAVKSVDGPA